MPRVRAIALGALLRPPQASGLRGLGEMHSAANPAQLLDYEPPARRCLKRNLEFLAAETRQELPYRTAIRRRHARPPHLTGLSVDPLAGDLSFDAGQVPLRCSQGASSSSTVSKPARTATSHLGPNQRRPSAGHCPAATIGKWPASTDPARLGRMADDGIPIPSRNHSIYALKAAALPRQSRYARSSYGRPTAQAAARSDARSASPLAVKRHQPIVHPIYVATRVPRGTTAGSRRARDRSRGPQADARQLQSGAHHTGRQEPTA
jgi:hypothetical protein